MRAVPKRLPEPLPSAAPAPGTDALGPRLRAARERAGVTVRGLARQIGVSPSLISQIELGRVMPSVGTLFAIANELQLVLDEVFRDSESSVGTPGRALAAADLPGPVQRKAGRKSLRLDGGVRWERLTAAPDDEVEFLYVVYDVGGESSAEDSLVRHDGREYAFLISGRLGVKIGFDEYELGPGDSLSFDARMPHRLWTIGKQPVIAIWVVLGRKGDPRLRVPHRTTHAAIDPPVRADDRTGGAARTGRFPPGRTERPPRAGVRRTGQRKAS